MLEFDDIQHILLTRTPALTGRYEFLSFRTPASGRTWLSAISETVQSAAEVLASDDTEKRWVTVAFTWNGLRALGLDEASLATFPKSSSKAWPLARRFSATRERTIPTTGWAVWRAPVSTPSSSSSLATRPSARDA